MTVPRLSKQQPVTADGRFPSEALLKILQEQAKAIEALEARVDALENP